MMTATCINWDKLSDEAKERLRLPIQYHGCGLRLLTDRRYSEYLDEGNHVPGQLNVPTVINLLGQHSFGSAEPWKVLVNIPTALGQREEEEFKFLQWHINSAGLDECNKPPPSVTRDITMELEAGHKAALDLAFGQWLSNAHENIAHRNVDVLSSQFLSSPPDAAGFIPDDEFIEIFTSYLDLPSPFPGTGHTIACDCIKLAFGDMAKVAGMQLQYEAENVFCGRLQEPYISRYCEHYLSATPHENSAHKDAVVPDILVHKYPVVKDRPRDENRLSQSSVPAIFEVKGVHVGKNPQARYPAGMDWGTDRRERQ
eukprot:14032868-Ditylum_brightwellii.AAC.1